MNRVGFGGRKGIWEMLKISSSESNIREELGDGDIN